MMAKRGRVSFRSLASLATEYIKKSGQKRDGASAIRTYLSLPDYSNTKRTVQQEITTIENTNHELSSVKYPCKISLQHKI